jgi:predicted nucleic acid-binding protein
MILYLDTSALVKLYVEEPGSRAVRALLERAQVVSTSRVAYVEMRAGLARKLHQGELREKEYKRIISDFEKDWKNCFVIEVSEGVAKLGSELVEKHPLRALDALHLASALFLRERVRSDVFFSSFDGRLNEAAQAEGLAVPSA